MRKKQPTSWLQAPAAVEFFLKRTFLHTSHCYLALLWMVEAMTECVKGQFMSTTETASSWNLFSLLLGWRSSRALIASSLFSASAVSKSATAEFVGAEVCSQIVWARAPICWRVLRLLRVFSFGHECAWVGLKGKVPWGGRLQNCLRSRKELFLGQSFGITLSQSHRRKWERLPSS